MAGLFARVHAVVRSIPRGKVATYGEVARAAGSPGAARQVVWALRQGSALPWHRVLGAGGYIRLGGEPGFEQQMRLRSEGVEVGGRGRVDLQRFAAKLKALRGALRADAKPEASAKRPAPRSRRAGDQPSPGHSPLRRGSSSAAGQRIPK